MVRIVSIEENGDGHDVVLEEDGVQVCGTEVDWHGVDDEDELAGLFEEWLELADDGDENFERL